MGIFLGALIGSILLLAIAGVLAAGLLAIEKNERNSS